MPTVLQKEREISWDELAKSLGVTRQAVAVWRKRDDAPAGRDVEEWRAFVDKHGLGESGPKTANGELKAQKIAEEVRRLKLINAKLERTSIERDEVDQLLHHIAAQQRSSLYQKLETELPPKLDGLPAAEIRAILRSTADEVCDIMATLVQKWRDA